MSIMPHNPFGWLFPKRMPKAVNDNVTTDKNDFASEFAPEIPCCSDDVHIAYRGISDDRLYLAENRKWHEVKFFRPQGLRVFCTKCRHRIY
jgi:hypothetical protein